MIVLDPEDAAAREPAPSGATAGRHTVQERPEPAAASWSACGAGRGSRSRARPGGAVSPRGPPACRARFRSRSRSARAGAACRSLGEEAARSSSIARAVTVPVTVSERSRRTSSGSRTSIVAPDAVARRSAPAARRRRVSWAVGAAHDRHVVARARRRGSCRRPRGPERVRGSKGAEVVRRRGCRSPRSPGAPRRPAATTRAPEALPSEAEAGARGRAGGERTASPSSGRIVTMPQLGSCSDREVPTRPRALGGPRKAAPGAGNAVEQPSRRAREASPSRTRGRDRSA